MTRRHSRKYVAALTIGAAVTHFLLFSTSHPTRAFAATSTHQPFNQTIYNTPVPSIIRVAIRANNDPRGPILWVQTVGFQEYCTDVLPNEWGPDWDYESLKAGALAIKMFAWYHTLHPVTIDNFTFDVDNTVNFQQYKYRSGLPQTDSAVRQTWQTAYADAQGLIQELDYRSGIPNDPNWPFAGTSRMAQWGSQYWAKLGWTFLTILGFYYPQRYLLAIPPSA